MSKCIIPFHRKEVDFAFEMQLQDNNNHDIDLPYEVLVAMERQQAMILEKCSKVAEDAKREGDVVYQLEYKQQVLLFDPTFPVDTISTLVDSLLITTCMK